MASSFINNKVKCRTVNFSILLLIVGVQTCAQVPTGNEPYRDCATCPEMISIPAGKFVMGSPPNEPGRFANEGPVHPANIKSFAIGKYPVTRGEWAEFAKETNRPVSGGCYWATLPGDSTPWKSNPSASWNNLGFSQDDNHPAVCLTWQDAKDYAAWLSKKTGKRYRLPTEAEWEYAARAGTTTAHPWGNEASHEYANYGSDSLAGEGFKQGRDQWGYGTSPVGAFPPNAFGLFDMVGNSMQIVEDCYSKNYDGHSSNGAAYTDNDTVTLYDANKGAVVPGHACEYHICRGGSFGDPPAQIRSAFRNYAGPEPSYRSAGVGFRIAKDN